MSTTLARTRPVRLFSRILALLWQAAPGHTLVLFTLTVVQGLLPGLSVWLSKLVVDGVVSLVLGPNSPDRDAVLPVTFAWIAVALLSASLSPLGAVLRGLMTERVTVRVNLMLMHKAVDFPDISCFEDPRFYDELQVIQREAGWRPMNVLGSAADSIHTTVTGLSMLVLLGRFHLGVPFLMLTASLPQAAVSFKFTRKIFEAFSWKIPQVRLMSYFSSVLLTDAYAKEARIFGLGKYFIGKYLGAFFDLHQTMSRMRLKQASWALCLISSGVITSGAAFLWVVSQTMKGRFSPGDVILFMSAGVQAQQSLFGLVMLASALQESALYLQKFFTFLDSTSASGPKLVQDNQAKDICLKQGIVLTNVTFRYANGRIALNNVSLSIRAGETVALVGESGSGKTTLVKLLCRLYDPQEGSIQVDGIDLRDYDPEVWREQVSAVFQDYARYHLSAKENIGLGFWSGCHNNATAPRIQHLAGKAF